jgi:hypothetical protein
LKRNSFIFRFTQPPNDIANRSYAKQEISHGEQSAGINIEVILRRILTKPGFAQDDHCFCDASNFYATSLIIWNLYFEILNLEFYSMAFYQILYWQDIPSQIKVWDDFDELKIELSNRFTAMIDQAAQKQGLTQTDDYLAQWKWSDEEEREGTAEEVAVILRKELEEKY